MNAQHERLRRRGARQRDLLAELVAEGYSLGAAGRAIGVSQQRASQLFAQIRAGLGEQAR